MHHANSMVPAKCDGSRSTSTQKVNWSVVHPPSRAGLTYPIEYLYYIAGAATGLPTSASRSLLTEITEPVKCAKSAYYHPLDMSSSVPSPPIPFILSLFAI